MKAEEILSAAQPLIERTIEEDLGPGDATSEAVLPVDLTLRGCILAKADGVIAGLPVVEAVFTQVDPALQFRALVQDGDPISPGTVVAEVEGPARSMLAAERIALNFLQHLSGVATMTRAFVNRVQSTDVSILDTRKTLPGYRMLEKYAVRMGGGQNHRMGLYDMALIKDNHIDAAGSITAAVERCRTTGLPIEVEVRNLEELREALALGVDQIMLDNMSLDEMREAVRLTDGQTPLEASGGVDLDSVADIAATGVDYISVGALTHSAPALDLSMKIGGQEIQQVTSQTQVSVAGRAAGLKTELGDQVIILGHHYQRDEVIAFADFRGDSLKLARDASEKRDAKYIVFCGVHFMAETAAMLAQPEQAVLLPDLEAGCPLAEMARLEDVEAAWTALDQLIDVEREMTPITYVNSSAALKAFCGRHGGSVCTSSNAADVLAWALERRPRVLFFPDQHLGRNTAKGMGIPLEEMVLWNPTRDFGGHDDEVLQQGRIFLWRGWCNVHQRFRPEHVLAWREREPDIQVIVHPECAMEVVDLADEAGSTAYIVKRVEEAKPGAKWAIGTEFNLVNRLKAEHPEQSIASLSPEPSYCRTMNLITLEKLARVLEGLTRGELVNHVTVPDDVARDARIALKRMLEVSP